MERPLAHTGRDRVNIDKSSFGVSLIEFIISPGDAGRQYENEVCIDEYFERKDFGACFFGVKGV
jgi:hypothetical protein